MSSKRKSPPTKLHEGTTTTSSTTSLCPPTDPSALNPPTSAGSGSEGGGLETDLDETSSNLSDVDTPHHPPQPFYKLSGSSSAGSVSGSEPEDIEEERTPPPNKTARMMCSSEPNILMSTSIQALSLHADHPERRRNSSECSSPSSEGKMHLYHNNNNSLLNNNSHPLKRSMDDVLKRLTSKINNSTIKEEKRPTPSDVEPAAAIQQALIGDNLMEKDRKLSELIFQLQMVREQLLTQQQQQEATKVDFCPYQSHNCIFSFK
nr:unnamed protein product [Callosobruchus chinensis]